MGIFFHHLAKKITAVDRLRQGDEKMTTAPVRKIPMQSQRVTGQIATTKHSGAAVYESSLERDLIEILEFDAAVASFATQPSVIHYETDGRRRRYTPDILVNWVLDNGNRATWLCEVKYRTDLRTNWRELKPKFRAAVAHCRQRGMRFKILTEREIRTPYLENVRFLSGYKNESVSDFRVRLLLERLEELRETTPEILLASLNPEKGATRAQLIWLLWALTARGMVAADFTQRLTMNSRIWAVSGD